MLAGVYKHARLNSPQDAHLSTFLRFEHFAFAGIDRHTSHAITSHSFTLNMAAQDSYKGIYQSNAVQLPVEYEQTIYQKGLQYERPPFSFRSQDWESQAEARMSAESRGYVVGNASTGETARKNREAFSKWSIVPRRLVKTEGLPDMTASVLDHHLQFPIALAPVGVQRVYLLHSCLLISHTQL